MLKIFQNKKCHSNSNKIITRDAHITDLDDLISLHVKNMHKSELSLQLGINLLYSFYALAIENKFTRVKVLEFNKNICGLSIVFFKYYEFEDTFSKILLKYLINNLYKIFKYMHFKNFKTLLIMASSFVRSQRIKRIIPKKIYNHHIGLTILDQNYKFHPGITREFIKMYRENVSYLRLISNEYWSTCRYSNRPSARLLNDREMKFTHILTGYPEKIILAIHSSSNLYLKDATNDSNIVNYSKDNLLKQVTIR